MTQAADKRQRARRFTWKKGDIKILKVGSLTPPPPRDNERADAS